MDFGFEGDHRVSAEALDRCNLEFAGEFVAGHDRAGVNEALVAVNHATEVDVGLWVGQHGGQTALLDDHGEGRRGNQVVIAGGLGGEDIVVDGAGGHYGVCKLAHLFAAHKVGRCDGILFAFNTWINHVSKPNERVINRFVFVWLAAVGGA